MAAKEQQAVKAGTSNKFSVTCSHLRHYMMQQGSHSAVRLANVVAEAAPEETVEPTNTTREPQCARLIILYDRKRMVFEDVPAHKAEELMKAVVSYSVSVSSSAGHICSSYTCIPSGYGGQNMMPRSSSSSMPLERIESLHTFLEKKDMLVTADPDPGTSELNQRAKDDDAPCLSVDLKLSLG
ncbi:hypothetical protein EJB05_07827, partial [Eragrostis curvula]